MTGICAAIVAAALAAEPAKTPLRELGQLMVGRWVGDVTLVADWPDIGKRGTKIVAYVTVEWIADGHAFELHWHGGNGLSKEMFIWDAAAKQVRSMGVASLGRTWQTVWSKEGDHWKGKSRDSLGDGTEIEGGEVILTPEEGGKRLVLTNQGESRIGDEKLDPLHDVYTKVGEIAPADTPLKEYGDAVVGRWRGSNELVRDISGIGKTGETVVDHQTVRWIVDGHALESEFHRGKVTGKSLFVWDQVDKVIRFYNINSNGRRMSGTAEKDGDGWIWKSAGHDGDGAPNEGRGRTVISADGNTSTLSGSMIVGGERTPDFEYSSTRID